MAEAVVKAKITGSSAEWNAQVNTAIRTVNEMKFAVGNLAPVMAGAFSAAGAVAFVKRMADQGAEIEKMATTAGVSAEAIQRINFAAKETETNVEALDKSLARMQKNSIEAQRNPSGSQAQGFKDLGISVAELKQLGPEELFLRMAAGVAAAKDHAVALSAVIAIMGKSGIESFNMLAQGREKLQSIMDQAPIISDADIQRLAEAKREFTALGSELEVMLAGPISRFSKIMLQSIMGLQESGYALKLTWMEITGQISKATADANFAAMVAENQRKISGARAGTGAGGAAATGGAEPDEKTLAGEKADQLEINRLDHERAGLLDRITMLQKTEAQNLGDLQRKYSELMVVPEGETELEGAKRRRDAAKVAEEAWVLQKRLNSERVREEETARKVSEEISDKEFHAQLQALTRAERIKDLKKRSEALEGKAEYIQGQGDPAQMAEAEEARKRAAEFRLEAARLENEHAGGRRVDIFKEPLQLTGVGSRAVFAQNDNNSVLPAIRESNQQLRSANTKLAQATKELSDIRGALRSH